MKKTAFLGAFAVAGIAASAAMAQDSSTLDQVKERGKLNCGVATGRSGLCCSGRKWPLGRFRRKRLPRRSCCSAWGFRRC